MYCSFKIGNIFRYFIGSSGSTVSFRIREDREILGFEQSTTFNRFCGDDESDCEQPAHWTIVYWPNSRGIVVERSSLYSACMDEGLTSAQQINGGNG